MTSVVVRPTGAASAHPPSRPARAISFTSVPPPAARGVLARRAAIIVVALALCFALGLATRLLGQLESRVDLRVGQVPLLFFPLVAIPLLHLP